MTFPAHAATMRAMDSELEQRLDKLETRNAYLERSIQELSDCLYGQQRHIDRLEAVLRTVSARVKELAPTNNDLPTNERPPHY